MKQFIILCLVFFGFNFSSLACETGIYRRADGSELIMEKGQEICFSLKSKQNDYTIIGQCVNNVFEGIHSQTREKIYFKKIANNYYEYGLIDSQSKGSSSIWFKPPVCVDEEKSNNPCMKFIESISDSKINYSQIMAYTEKELESRKDLRNTIKESMPTGNIGNAWVWSESGSSLVRANTSNELNYNISFKPLNITSHLAMLGSVSKKDRIASAREKVDEAIGNLYSDDKAKQMQAYSFLKRAIKDDNTFLNQCLSFLTESKTESTSNTK